LPGVYIPQPPGESFITCELSNESILIVGHRSPRIGRPPPSGQRSLGPRRGITAAIRSSKIIGLAGQIDKIRASPHDSFPFLLDAPGRLSIIKKVHLILDLRKFRVLYGTGYGLTDSK
jgi:hypothetical protein